MFNSAYGSPRLLPQYKLEYFWLFFSIIYFMLAFSFDPLPSFNKVIDEITRDRRVAFTIYWFPSVFYLSASISSLSDFLSWQKRQIVLAFGGFTIFWHLLYFILFWAIPSERLPNKIEDMSVTAGWYWSEIFVNLILILIQMTTGAKNRQYNDYMFEKFDKVKEDVNKFLNLWEHLPDTQICLKSERNQPDDAQEQENLKDNDNNFQDSSDQNQNLEPDHN